MVDCTTSQYSNPFLKSFAAPTRSDRTLAWKSKGCQKKAIGFFEHVDNRNKDIFIFGKNLTDGLDDTTITVELESKAKDYKRKAY